MPISPPPFARRTLLAGAGLLTLAACDGDDTPSPGTTGSAPGPTPAGPDPLRTDIATVESLLSVYDQTLRAHPALAARLRPLRGFHAQHLAALKSAVGDAAAAPPPVPTTVPPQPAAAVGVLRRAEGTASASLARSALRASGGRAALLASIATASATYTQVLS
jgi:hypothetical protein